MRRFGKKMLNEWKYDVIDLEFSDVNSQGGVLTYSFLDSDNKDELIPFTVKVYINGNKIDGIAFHDFLRDEELDVSQAAKRFYLGDKELNKIIQDVREEAEEYLIHRAVKESRRPRGRMLKEFYFEDPEDARRELYQGEYECCYCGREVTGAEGYCRNDDGEICCIDCYEERFGKNESRQRRGRMLKEESEDYYTYTIPEWTLSYIFNDDPSGLEDDEIEAVDNFVASLPKGWVIDVDEDENGNIQTFFSHTNDLPGKHGKLGNTCVDVKITVF